ncbi:MAG: L-arabinose ABC transporter permease AraH [Bacteriovoracales bacterium]
MKKIINDAGMWIVFLILFVGVSLFVPNFFSIINMKGLALSVSMVGMVATTMLFTLAAGHFDLSIESLIACSGVLAAVVINSTGSVFLGITAGLLIGLIVGVFNGVVIAKFKINALITTLATMQIVRGMGYIFSDGKAVGILDEKFFILGNSQMLGIPTPIWITALCFLIFGFLLNKTIFGRDTLAIGGNQEASRLAGINVDKRLITIFALQGLMAAFAGIVLASRMTSGQPATSQGFALEVISACVLGGVSLTGGIGSMSGVIVGVLIMGTVQNAMNLLNIEPFYQYVVRGIILLGAVLLDRYKQKA